MRKWDFVTYTHNKQRVSGGKTCNIKGYADVKSLGKYEQSYQVTASVVEKTTY